MGLSLFSSKSSSTFVFRMLSFWLIFDFTVSFLSSLAVEVVLSGIWRKVPFDFEDKKGFFYRGKRKRGGRNITINLGEIFAMEIKRFCCSFWLWWALLCVEISRLVFLFCCNRGLLNELLDYWFGGFQYIFSLFYYVCSRFLQFYGIRRIFSRSYVLMDLREQYLWAIVSDIEENSVLVFGYQVF